MKNLFLNFKKYISKKNFVLLAIFLFIFWTQSKEIENILWNSVLTVFIIFSSGISFLILDTAITKLLKQPQGIGSLDKQILRSVIIGSIIWLLIQMQISNKVAEIKECTMEYHSEFTTQKKLMEYCNKKYAQDNYGNYYDEY